MFPVYPKHAAIRDVPSDYFKIMGDCDLVIVILGERYSEHVNNEINYAFRNKMPVLCFIKDCERDRELDEEVGLIETNRVTTTKFKTLEDLCIGLREAVLELFETIVNLGVDTVIPYHLSLAAVAADPDLLARVSEILSYKKDGEMQIRGKILYHGKRYMSVETGLETGSPRIIAKYMRGKCLPFKPEEWPDVVEQAYGILNDNEKPTIHPVTVQVSTFILKK